MVDKGSCVPVMCLDFSTAQHSHEKISTQRVAKWANEVLGNTNLGSPEYA